MDPHCRPRLILWLATGLILASCKDTRIATYRAPKESRFTPAANAAKTGIHWQAPASWKEQPASEMRQGSFAVTGADGAKADMSVSAFPGDVGGDLANVNRWRGQIQLPPFSAAELPNAVTKVDAPAGQFLVVDLLSDAPVLAGSHKTRVLGAILKQSTQTWFFKLAGDADLVAAQKSAFIGFLQSVQINSEAASPTVAAPKNMANTNDLPPDARGVPGTRPPPSGTVPPGHPPLDGMTAPADMASTPVAVANNPPLAWTAPADWTPKTASAIRKGSYTISGPEGEGDLSITAFPGDVGGDLANVNRWRGQLQLPPVSDVAGALEPFDANGLHMLVFDAGNSGTRILGAIVPRPGETWFFKLTGPDALVARTKPAFLSFLQTVKAP